MASLEVSLWPGGAYALAGDQPPAKRVYGPGGRLEKKMFRDK